VAKVLITVFGEVWGEFDDEGAEELPPCFGDFQGDSLCEACEFFDECFIATLRKERDGRV